MTGSGTLADPYIILDVDDLQAMKDDLTAYYELGGDIDASATSGWNGGLGFEPIGTWTTSFTGYFDGKGYKISGLTINRPTGNITGLFGGLESTGLAVKNVGLDGGSITGQHYVGALVGLLRSGDIDNCYSTAPVSGDNHDIGGLLGGVPSGATVTNCYCTGNVTARNVSASSWIGGFAGVIDGTVSRCYCTGNVTMVSPIDSGNGGFTGRVYDGAVVDQCYCTGDVNGGDNHTGGFAGENWGTITDCYARGDVDGNDNVGGFIGNNGTTSFEGRPGIVINCYSTGAPSGATNVGGLIGVNSLGTITDSFWDTQTSSQAGSDGGTGKTTAEMKTQSTFTDAGWDFDSIWGMDALINDGYPYLLWLVAPIVGGGGNPGVVELLT